MRHVTPFIAVACVVVLAACTDNTVQPNAPTLNAAIQDGNHAGNPNFFFLPPLVPNPVGSPNFNPATFNAKLAPVVEVCRLAGNPVLDPTTSCGPLVFGPASMALDATNQQYQLNWDTQASPLDATAFYRITVRGAARGTALGFLDIDPVLGGMKNPKTGDVFIFTDGRTLPIKVRIQQGAFGSTNSNDVVEQVVPNVIPSGTLDVTTNTGFAGARFTSGWLNPNLGIDQVVVIIERVGANCLSSGLEQMEGCYRFRTDPDLHQIEGGLPFAKNVIAGVCFQIPADIGGQGPPFELARQEEVGGQASGPLTRLAEVPAPFIHCDSFGPTTQTIGAAFRSGRLGDIAKAGWHAMTQTIARAIQPAALHAVDLGAGGSTDGFSFFGYARFASMTVTAGDGATAPAGSTLQASVQVQNNHHAVTSPVVGQSVTFTVTGGGGSVSTGTCSEGNACAATTDGAGNATVTWRLGTGVNTLQAATSHVTNSPVSLTATGVVVPLAGYQLATSGPFALAATTGFVRDVATCSAGNVILGGGAQVVAEGTADFNTRLQESAPGIVGAATNVWLVAIHNESANPHSLEFFATCASAPVGYQVATTDVVISAGSFARQTANCPAGKVVLGGGAQVAGEGVADFNTRLQESAPGIVNFNTNIWLASVRNQDLVPHTVRIFAVCAPAPQGYEVVTGAITSLAAGGGFNRDAVPCPAGKVILGGGAQVVGEGTADFNTRLQESTPGLTGLNNATNVWLVSMKNLDGVAHNVRFFAVCANAA
jgi:hypothetical protein